MDKKTEEREIIRLHGEYLSADERRTTGKALRESVPRASHGGWDAPKDRRDPIDILNASNEGRLPQLIPIRFGRMSQSPFAFYRGAAAIMAADLASTPQSGLRVQACGDAHLMNFGGFATPERNIIFDINDFDETLPGPWEWDIKRLAASVVIAAHHLRLADSDAAKAATDTVCSYRERMIDYAAMRALDVWYDFIDVDRIASILEEAGTEKDRKEVEHRIKQAQKKSTPEILFPKLAEHLGAMPTIKDEPPLIFHPTVEQAPGLKSGYREPIAQYRETLPEHIRVLFDRFHFRDLAFKAVGVDGDGPCVQLPSSWPGTMTRSFCKSRKPRRRCWSHTWERASIKIMVRGSWQVSTSCNRPATCSWVGGAPERPGSLHASVAGHQG